MKFQFVNDIDTNLLKTTIANAPAFPHFCIDNFLEESFANEVCNSFPSYSDAEKLGRTFNAVNEKKKIQIPDSTKFPDAILKLNNILASDEFVKMVSDVMGIKNLVADPTLAGGGIHETNSGGHLDVHIDFNYNPELDLHRRVNILIYFNKDWPENYGGILDLWDTEVKNCQGRFLPLFNRAVGFNTSEISWHGVTPITCPTDVMRKSFAVYYYTKEAPDNWDGKKHSTVFKARPDEYWKGNIAMPAENVIRSAKQGINAAKQLVKNILNQ